MTAYLNDMRPNFKPRTINCGSFQAYSYKGSLKSELAAKNITKQEAAYMFEDMLTIREFEEMIVKLRSQAYEPCKGYDYRGPTHVSIGQEGVSTGACFGMDHDDCITSTHRGHGDSIAKGCVAIRGMTDEKIRTRIPNTKATTRKELLDEAMEDHVYKTIAELFGKEEGYCKGRGGGMHIADFTAGHLGANAIVGGGVPIVAGAAMAERYMDGHRVFCCFAGDGAYANGVVLESLNWAAMGQFTHDYYAKNKKYGLPVIFLIVNNHYAMTGRSDEEVLGVEFLARRGVGFADNNMHAEVVNGMDIMAVRDALKRASKGCREGKGPYMVEVNTYRYYGHSLSDPRNEYRTKDEEAAWKAIDPIDSFEKQLLETKTLSAKEIAAIKQRVIERNARAAQKAAKAADPDASEVIRYMYTDTTSEIVPEANKKVTLNAPLPVTKRTDGQIAYKDAIRDAIQEEMLRDNRVFLYGEDVAEYGGAFKVTKGLIESFGRNRIFNTPISEACICGTAVGAAMLGLRPIAELMYMDFALMASDQISNQASKWHYMSGANVEIPLVYRASVGGGKGYGGQHSQTLESMFTNIPGLILAYPATPYDAKGLLKTAIRDNNPVMFIESQLLYNIKGPVPENEYLIPFGQANIVRPGTDCTLVVWGPAYYDAIKAVDAIKAETGKSVELIDLRTLVPLDMETVLTSVRKTGRCVVASQCVSIGSFTGEIASRIMDEAFDYLDAPVQRVGARDGIAPQSHVLEAAFLPNDKDIAKAIKRIL